VKYPDISTTL